jgi:hypothetical protein
VEHLRRLWKETLVWQRTNETIGGRYFAGVSPLFADVAEHVARVQDFCAEAGARYAAAVRRRKQPPATPPIDVDELRAEAATLVPPCVESIVARAREQFLILTAERAGTFSIRQRVHQALA